MKNIFASKTAGPVKRVMIVVTIIAIIAIVVGTLIQKRNIKNSNNEAAREMLKQIALSQVALMPEDCFTSCPDYAFTDGVNETAEAAVMRLTEYGLRPNSSVAFHVARQTADKGYIIFAAHSSVGSTVYVYDSIAGEGVQEVLENDAYADKGSGLALFCYRYDPANADNPIEKKVCRSQSYFGSGR